MSAITGNDARDTAIVPEERGDGDEILDRLDKELVGLDIPGSRIFDDDTDETPSHKGNGSDTDG